MTHEGLNALAAQARHLSQPTARDAMRAVPELADGLPPIRREGSGLQLWSACADALRPLAAAVVAEAVGARGPTPAVVDLERKLASDPLVAMVASLSREGAALSPGAATVPFLQTLALTAAAAHTEAGDGDARFRVALAVCSRLVAAGARSTAEGVPVPWLAAAAAGARTAAVWPRTPEGPDPSVVEVCAIVGASVPGPLADAALAAVQVAVRCALARRAEGKATPDDEALFLRHVPPPLADAGAEHAARAVARDPDAVITVLGSLELWADARALTSAGIEGGIARRLAEPAAGLATASALADALHELRRWDIIGSLCALLTHPANGRRGLVIPRGGSGRAAVVAVNLGRLRADAGRQSEEAVTAVDLSFADAARAARGVASDVGHAGLFAFDDAVDALRFALAAQGRFGTGVPVGLGLGAISGGSDGAAVRLAGPAVDGALRWMAVAPMPPRAGGTLRVQHLANAGGWLGGTGIGIDAAADEGLQEARVRHGLATAADGPAAGDTRVPRSLDLHRAFEHDGEVLALVRIAGMAGGFEVLHLPTSEWRALLNRDQEVSDTPSPLGSPAAPGIPAPSPEPAVAGGAEAWATPESEDSSDQPPVMLDLDEAAAPVLAPNPAYAFDAAPEDFETEEEGRDSVSGFYLPGLKGSAEEPGSGGGSGGVASPEAPSTAPVFDMEVVDDEEGEVDEPILSEESERRPVSGSMPEPRDPFVSVPGAADESGYFIPPARRSGPLRGRARWRSPRGAGNPRSLHRTAPGCEPRTRGVVYPFSAPAFSDAFATGNSNPFAEPAPDTSDGFAEPDPYTQDEPRPEASSRSFSTAFSAPPEPHPSPSVGPPRAGPRGRPALLDFAYLLSGYTWFTAGTDAVFGRPYGARLVDRHVYPYTGDADDVYTRFLADKIGEGFVPRTELMGDVPAGADPQPLDIPRLARVWARIS